MRARVVAFAAGVAAFAGAPAAAQLQPAEQAIVATVEDGFESDVALLEKITLINSGSHNHVGVKAVADATVDTSVLGAVNLVADGAA